MKKYLIVDAYNMINQWALFKDIAGINLEEAREKITDLLQSYCKIKSYYLILVFDAYNNDDGLKEIIWENGKIVFTQKNQTADSYIEKLMYELPSFCDIYVATSDYTIQRIVIARGGMRISALELEKEIQFTLNTYLKKNKENYEREKNNVLNLIDEDTFEKLQKIKNQESSNDGN